MAQTPFLSLTAPIRSSQTHFLQLTAPVSKPFVPSLDNELKELKLSLVEEAIKDDLIGDALVDSSKPRRNSGFTITSTDEITPLALHARADSVVSIDA